MSSSQTVTRSIAVRIKTESPADYIRRHELSLLRLIARRYPQDAKKIFIEILNEKTLQTAR